MIATREHDTVAAFSHAGVLRTILDIVLDAKIPRYKVLCRNCAIAVFEYKDGIWHLDSWINK